MVKSEAEADNIDNLSGWAGLGYILTFALLTWCAMLVLEGNWRRRDRR